jgi:hypothetical protein
VTREKGQNIQHSTFNIQHPLNGHTTRYGRQACCGWSATQPQSDGGYGDVLFIGFIERILDNQHHLLPIFYLSDDEFIRLSIGL